MADESVDDCRVICRVSFLEFLCIADAKLDLRRDTLLENLRAASSSAELKSTPMTRPRNDGLAASPAPQRLSRTRDPGLSHQWRDSYA